ncbi:DUF305 domain-containing protein [Jatrophihabitans fulvus]
MTLTEDREITEDGGQPASAPNGLRRVLIVVIAVAALVIAAGGGWLLRGTDSSSSTDPNAVDVGFAQDMTTHHVQAVTMAGIERDGTSNSTLRILATDMETGQQFQVGQMAGWLQNWGKGRTNENQMGWMGHDHMSMGSDGLMPGMATAAQMDKLVKLKGKALDILFLQLMIHHHQGGLPMARYAVEHASQRYVRDLAQSMISAQSSEIVYMEQLLRQLGGTPLPPPA